MATRRRSRRGRRARRAAGASQTRAAWVGAVVASPSSLVVRRASTSQPAATPRPRSPAALVAVVDRARHRDAARRPRRLDVRRRARHQRRPLRRMAHRVAHDRGSSGARRRARGLPRRVPAGGRRRRTSRDYGVAVFPDRAHNGILDVTIVGGAARRPALRRAARARAAARVARAARRAIRSPSRSARRCSRTSCSSSSCSRSPSSIRSSGCSSACSWRARHAIARTATVRARWLVVPIAIATVARVRSTARAKCSPTAQLKRAANDTTDVCARSREADDATRLRPDSIRTWYVAARVARRGDALTDVDAALDRVLARPRPFAARPGAARALRRAARRARRPLAPRPTTSRPPAASSPGSSPTRPTIRACEKPWSRAHSLREIGKP